MPDRPEHDDKLRERLDADDPGAPPGYLLDPDDRRTPCAIGLERDDDRDEEATP